MKPPQEECAICLDALSARDGQALFTAECSHIFHFNCIANNVQHGNHICPSCRSKWTNLPSQFTPASSTVNSRSSVEMTRLIFADDEPLPTPTPTSTPAPSPAPNTSSVSSEQTGKMTVKAFPERPAMGSSEQSDSFSVLVGIRAPALSPEGSDRPDARAPVDLVAVLDVSGSMHGEKMRLLKQAICFVVDNLGPTDRLSIITFSTTARRITPLRLMADRGQSHTIQEINSLQACGSTNIKAGLKMAVQVLEQRRQKNPVASIILLSDGQDNQSGSRFLETLPNLPSCIRANATDHAPDHDVVPVPVHTFGFGSDHDAAALHAIADGSGGTFSYIESIGIIQDAFALCIGGLLSVVAQQVEVRMQSGVKIQSISSGRYKNTVENNDGKISVGDVYAEENKQFLVNLSVPQETDLSSTKLLEVMCSYKDPVSTENVITETITVEICRPATENLTEADRQVCSEVEIERNRISVAEEIAQARSMADRGDVEEAREFLFSSRSRRRMTARTMTGGACRMSRRLDAEVEAVEERMRSREMYEEGGRANLLSLESSHTYQRASTRALKGRGNTIQDVCVEADEDDDEDDYEEAGYQTTNMKKMVKKSQKLRQNDNQGEQSGSQKRRKHK